MALSGSVFEIWHVTDRQTDRQTSAPFHDMATHSGPHNNITTTGCVYQTHTEHFYNISTVPKWLTHVFYVLLAKCGGSNPFENEFLGWKKTKARSETLQSDRTLQTINLHYRPWKRELAKWNSAVGQNSTNYQPSLPPMPLQTINLHYRPCLRLCKLANCVCTRFIIISGFGIYGAAVVPDSAVGKLLEMSKVIGTIKANTKST